MTEHANATLARRGYAAFSAGDMDTLRGMMREDVSWHQPGTTPIAGDYLGRDRVFDFFGMLFERSGGTLKVEPVDVLADDERAVVLQHSTARRDGKELDYRQVLVFEIRDGKIADTQVYEGDPQQGDLFWS